MVKLCVVVFMMPLLLVAHAQIADVEGARTHAQRWLKTYGPGDRQFKDDPCKVKPDGFIYGDTEASCRTDWLCQGGASVPRCCPAGTSYVEGWGCRLGTICREPCPIVGWLAMESECDKKPHWDKHYYIQIIYGRGEVVRPCPRGTIYFVELCDCDVESRKRQATTPSIMYGFGGLHKRAKARMP